MSYFTETFNLILEGIDTDDVIDASKAIGKGVAATALSGGNPIAGVQAGMGEMKYPYEIEYASEDGKIYHGKMAYKIAGKEYIEKKNSKKKMSFKEKLELKNKVEARLNMAIAYERYDFNKVLNMYPLGYIKNED